MVAANWVEQELKHIDLGEARLEKRLRKIVNDFSQNPTASIPEFCGGWSATKAAYSFFANPASDEQKIIKAQRQGTLVRIKGQSRILILQDTTSFDFSAHPHTKGLGLLDNAKSRGFLTHTSLVVTPDGVPLGVLAQESWVRDEDELGKSAQRHQRPITDKESYKWLKALDFIRALQPRYIVPGHGPLCDVTALDRLTDYLSFLRRRTLNLFNAGRTKQETASLLIPELKPWFPIPSVRSPKIESQIRSGIGRVYDEHRRAYEARQHPLKTAA